MIKREGVKNKKRNISPSFDLGIGCSNLNTVVVSDLHIDMFNPIELSWSLLGHSVTH